jgi:transposase
MPEEYGSYATAWRRLRRLQETGVWGRIMEFLKSMRRCERLAIDSTTMEAKGGWRSRIRWIHRKGTKIHVVVGERSKPIALALSPGNVHDSRIFNKLYDEVERKLRGFYGDSAYDTCEVRGRLEGDGVQANIAVNPKNGRRQIPYDEEGYRVMRSAIERFNAWLKTFRRVVIGYERLAVMFQAIITFACIMIHMRYGGPGNLTCCIDILISCQVLTSLSENLSENIA